MDEIQIDEKAFINSANKFGVQSANNLGLSFTVRNSIIRLTFAAFENEGDNHIKW